jgi:uncharacterized protein (DUF1501 family)
MLTRRQMLIRALRGTSLFAVGSVVPEFILNTGRAAEAGKETVLVVLEMTGGNDGLNTVIPYTDDLYHKARPTLALTKDQVIKVDDAIGLNPALSGLSQLLQNKHLAIVQGVGYPNPDRSHFESMDVWQSGEVGRKQSGTGWLARGVLGMENKGGGVSGMQVGAEKLPLAMQGAPSIVSVNDKQTYQLNLGAGSKERQTANLERLQEVLRDSNNRGFDFGNLTLYFKLQLVSQLIARGFGTRVFYLSIDGFDTHSKQAEDQKKRFEEIGQAVSNFYQQLAAGGNDKRVVLMTFSEFGRRVAENGSKGTDHGAASCLFVAGPAVQGGLVGKHPSLADLDSGDLKHHTDFRRVYATLLDGWLGCDSKAVLGGEFEHLPLLAKG